MGMFSWFKKLFIKKESSNRTSDSEYRLNGVMGKTIANRVIHVEDVGIEIKNCVNIVIDGCEFYGGDGKNSHAILVLGKSRNITIRNCKIHNMRLGHSEAISINGDVEGFLIENNELWNLDNIGIDIIGYEGNSPVNDYARNGEIRNNYIRNTFGKDAYAAAIYVDGGGDIRIQYNDLRSNQIGIEIASEHIGRDTAFVLVSNNRIADSSIASIAYGGYERDRGGVRDCEISNNTLTGNPKNGHLWRQHNVGAMNIINNFEKRQ